MKRITLWFLGTLSALLLILGYHTSTSSSMANTGTQPAIVSGATAGPSSRSTSESSRTPGTTTSGSGGSGGSGAGSTGSSGSSGKTSAKSASTTVTGSVAQTRWGPVQVLLTVADGAITQVAVVRYPDGNGRDQEINSYALPILIQETTSAQSADIDMVSGATVTSGGYLQSLQSALDQAKL